MAVTIPSSGPGSAGLASGLKAARKEQGSMWLEPRIQPNRSLLSLLRS